MKHYNDLSDEESVLVRQWVQFLFEIDYKGPFGASKHSIGLEGMRIQVSRIIGEESTSLVERAVFHCTPFYQNRMTEQLKGLKK